MHSILDMLRLSCLPHFLFLLSQQFVQVNFTTLRQNKKYVEVELGLRFEIETAETRSPRIFIVYSMLTSSEMRPWKPHACYYIDMSQFHQLTEFALNYSTEQGVRGA